MSNFNNLWAIYPRKVSKRMAQKAFERLTADEQAQAIEAMPDHIKYWKTSETALAYIPHLSTWLNQYRFEDEIVIEEPKAVKKPPLPFYATEELTMQKAREIGITPYAGEGWAELRMRISNRIKQLEGQL